VLCVALALWLAKKMNGTNDAEAARGQNDLASNRTSWATSTNYGQKGGQEMGRVRNGIFYGGVKEEPRRVRNGIFYDGLKKETVINIE